MVRKEIMYVLWFVCIAFFITNIVLEFRNAELNREVERLYKENVILRDENTELKWEIDQIDYIVCTYEGVIVYE